MSLPTFNHRAPGVVKRAGFIDEIGRIWIHPAVIGNARAILSAGRVCLTAASEAVSDFLIYLGV
jgi:hypothetical protein